MNTDKELVPCIYQAEMAALGIEVELCPDFTLKKKKYCKNHNKCKCGLFTSKRKLHYCPMCICQFKNCNNPKGENLDTCGKHYCILCKKEKNVNDNYCNNCICPFENCSNSKTNGGKGKGCYSHTCGICHDLKKRNGKCGGGCKCKMCSNDKCNEAACYRHTCKICQPLYKIAKSFLLDNSNSSYYGDCFVHAVTDESHVEFFPDYCPNVKTTYCKSQELGYAKSDKCLQIIPDCPPKKYTKVQYPNICIECCIFNKCQMCSNMRSLNGNVLHFGYYCDSCVEAGICINCNINKWIFKKIGSYSYKDKKKICAKCKKETSYCRICEKLYPKDSIMMLASNDKTECAKCIIKCDDDNDKLLKASLIVWKKKDVGIIVNFTQKIYNSFNPNKLSYTTIFDLMLILQWELPNRDFFIDTLISFLNMKNDERLNMRLSRINGGTMIDYGQHGVLQYRSSNTLGLLARCALLPKDLFIMILNML